MFLFTSSSSVLCDLHTLDYLVVWRRKCGLSMKGSIGRERDSLQRRRRHHCHYMLYTRLRTKHLSAGSVAWAWRASRIKRERESLDCRRALNSALLIHNKLKGRQERIIVQLCTIAMKALRAGRRERESLSSNQASNQAHQRRLMKESVKIRRWKYLKLSNEVEIILHRENYMQRVL